MSATATAPKTRNAPVRDRSLLREVIRLSGLSNRQFANDVLGRHEAVLRSWLNQGTYIPAPVVGILLRWRKAGGYPPAPTPRRDPGHDDEE
jgi:hypothetical protein